MAAPTFTDEIKLSSEDVSTVESILVSVSANDDSEEIAYFGPAPGNRVYRRVFPVGDFEIPIAKLGLFGFDIEDVLSSVQRSVSTAKRDSLSFDVPAQLPDRPVVTTNFTISSWSTSGFTFAIVTPPDSPNGIAAYILTISGDDLPLARVEATSSPVSAVIPFSPDTYAFWPQGDDGDGDGSFDIDIQVAVEDDLGNIGPRSLAVTKTVAPVDTYYIDDADITITSVTDEGLAGLVDITLAAVSPGFTLQSPWDGLRVTARALPDGADATTMLPLDWATLGSTVPITAGETVQVQSGVDVSGTAYVAFLMRRSDTGEFALARQPQTVTIQSLTASPPTISVAPAITGLVSHGGTLCADVGVLLSLDATWSGSVSRANRFRLDGSGVETAVTDQPATYTPTASDLGKILDGRCTAVNGNSPADQSVAFAPSYLVVDEAPAAVGSLSAVEFEAGDGTQTILSATVAAAFSGERLTYGIISTGGATIDSSTGEVTILDPEEEFSETITITASNTGGQATQSVLVSCVEEGDDFEIFISDNQWSVSEATEAEGQPEGTIKFTLGNITVPEGYGVRLSANADTLGPETIAATMSGNPNSSKYFTKEAFPVGTQVRNAVYMRRFEGEDWRPTPTKSLVIQGFGTVPDSPSVPGGNWESVPSAALTRALNMSQESFNTSDTSTNQGGFRGPIEIALAYQSWVGSGVGNTSLATIDNSVLARVRNCLTGSKCPACNAGFSMQFEAMNWAAAAVLVKLTPRLWGQLTGTEQQKVTALINGLTVAAAWSCSDWRNSKVNGNKRQGSWVSETTKMNGTGNNYSLRGNINYRMAHVAMVTFHSIFNGGTAATVSFLNNDPFQPTADALQSLGLTNAANGAFTDSRSGGKPSVAEVNTCCEDWRKDGITASNPVGLFAQYQGICFGKNCFEKHPKAGQNNGPPSDRAQLFGYPGSITTQLQNLHGQLGMPAEMDAGDGGGVRSSMTYSWFDLKSAWGWWVLMLAGGLLAKNSQTAQSLKARCNVGFTWFEAVGEIGWYDYSKSGEGGGNRDFKFSAPFSGSTMGNVYAVDVGLPMWNDVIYPML